MSKVKTWVFTCARLVAFLVVFLVVFPLAQALGADAEPLHVMLDPGHGGIDTGATRGKLRESEIALKVAGELASLLRNDPRFTVSMTRTSDSKVSLHRRTQLAKEANADVFVSIHLNSSTDPRARGKEIYFQNQIPADEEALFLASRENSSPDADAESEESAESNADARADLFSPRTDLKRILDDLHRNQRILSSSELSRILLETWEAKVPSARFGSRAIRQAPFQVVSLISIPSVLVEIGFISHAQEGPLLAQAAYQKTLARSLYEGLVKYKETAKNL